MSHSKGFIRFLLNVLFTVHTVPIAVKIHKAELLEENSNFQVSKK